MNKEILRLAIPNIISNISVPLLSTVDTALMGRLSAAHVGAVGLGVMVFNLVYWNFGFLRMGTTGITAQAFGSRDDAASILTLGRALLVALLLAALVLLLQVPLGQLSFYLMHVLPEQYGLISEYYYIRIWAAPATLGLYAFMGWFFGMQNAIYPLLLTIFINVVNIAFSFLFIVYYGMDVDGVAWGTVIAQYAGFLLAFILFALRYRPLLQRLQRRALLELKAFKQFLLINRDIFIRTVCLTFVFAFFYRQSSGGGETILAVNIILQQFISWMSYGVDGFAYASESLVGKYKGAADQPKLHRAIRLSFVWGMVLAALYSLSFWLFDRPLLAIFTDQAELIDASLPYIPWVVLLPLVATPCYLWDGIFVGLTASRAMRDCMLLSLLVFLLAFYTLDIFLANHGLWLALTIFMVARGGLQWLWFKKKGLAIY
ncbi:MAG: MATE family efflux transporter [Bacteroidota bacterium]